MNSPLLSLDAVIVDLDGTMVDTLGDFVVALNCMLADLVLPPVDRPLVERLVGKGSEHLIRSVLFEVLNRSVVPVDRTSLAMNTGADVERLYPRGWQSYQAHYADINGQHSDVYAGVIDGLEQLRGRGLRLACLTNKPTAFAQQLLKAKGLDGYFGLTFGGDAFEKKKPDPLPLRRTCEALGTAPARTLMVGDSSNDAQSARAAGCPVVLVTYGYNHGEPVRAVDADGFVDSLAELGALLG